MASATRSKTNNRENTGTITTTDENTLQVAPTKAEINIVASLQAVAGDLPISELRALTAKTIREAGTAAKQLATICQILNVAAAATESFGAVVVEAWEVLRCGDVWKVCTYIYKLNCKYVMY